MALISIIKKSDVDKAKRFDAEYFKPEYLEIEKKLEKIKTDFLYNLSNNKYKKFNPKKKDEYFNYIEISNINLSNGEYKIEKVKNEIKPSRAQKICNKFDLLISTVRPNRNAISLILEQKENLISSNGFCKLKDIKINPYFLFILLKTKNYINLLDRKTTATQYPAVNEEDILNLKIPILPNSFQLEIEKIVKQAKEKQNQAKENYKQAEEILLKELNLLDFKIINYLTFITTKKEVDKAKRFDADYFQPKYNEIIKHIENYKNGFCKVGDFNFNKKNYFPKENEKYFYIPLSKVSSNGEIEKGEKELGKDLPTRARRKVKKGEIILSSIEGSLETSALIQEEQENFIVSNGFYVFNSNKINSETLLVLVKSKIFIELLNRISKGAILGGYDLESFKKIKIPLIDEKIQEEISKLIKESHQLRKESKELLEEAKSKVENEIERRAS